MSVREEMMVRVYRNPDNYKKDAQRLAQQGWRVANAVERRPRSGCMRLVLLFWIVLIFPPKPEIVVTYARAVGYQMAGYAPGLAQCPRCGQLINAAAPKCPACGYKPPRR